MIIMMGRMAALSSSWELISYSQVGGRGIEIIGNGEGHTS